MDVRIRKVVAQVEHLHAEAGRPVTPPLRSAVVAAVVSSPWAGRGFVQDLKPDITELAPTLGDLLTDRLLELLGTKEDVEAYGKAGLCGLDGELEHASALIHTLRFGNRFRDKVDGSSYLSFTNKRGSAGSAIIVPLIHKNDSSLRSHYLTAELAIPDAPRNDEIVVAIAASTGGRPFPRLGNRQEDMVELGLA
ncbi:MAG: amino acid synthesis family protein [Actinobacteria bacterium]|nr:amino acid synthesis family protein [Actinomycetota bacterium]